MISGKPPFRCDSISELYSQIKGVKYTCPSSFSAELKALLSKLLVKDTTKRITMDELRIETWLNLHENEPPLRKLPTVKVSQRQPGADLDAEIDSLVLKMEKTDGYTAYVFRKSKGSSTPEERQSLDNVSAVGTTPVSVSIEVPSKQSPISQSGTTDEGYNSATTSQKGKSRRGSSGLSGALAKLNPFGSREIPTTNPKPNSPPAASDKKRSQSVAPGSSAYQAAVNRPSAPVSPSSTTEESKLQYQRRHSVATPAPAQPIEFQKEPESIRGRTSSNTKINRAPPSANENGLSVAAATQNRRRSVQPSMDQITENEETSRFTSVKRDLQPVPTHGRRFSVQDALGFGRTEGYSDEIRTARFSFQLQSVNQKDPVVLMKQIESILNNSFMFSKIEFGENGLITEKRGKFVYNCRFTDPASGDVIFDVEIVKVWLLPMLAVKIKRLGGDGLRYKAAYEKIVTALKG
jgi:hypothetical protein